MNEWRVRWLVKHFSPDIIVRVFCCIKRKMKNFKSISTIFANRRNKKKAYWFQTFRLKVSLSMNFVPAFLFNCTSSNDDIWIYLHTSYIPPIFPIFHVQQFEIKRNAQCAELGNQYVIAILQKLVFSVNISINCRKHECEHPVDRSQNDACDTYSSPSAMVYI